MGQQHESNQTIQPLNYSQPDVEEYSMGQQSESSQTVPPLYHPHSDVCISHTFSDICPFFHSEPTIIYEPTSSLSESTIQPATNYCQPLPTSTTNLPYGTKPIFPTNTHTKTSKISRRKIQRRQKRDAKRQLNSENKTILNS